MEIPDVIVVNKANHPLTDSMMREIRGVLALGPVTTGRCRSSRPRRPRAGGSTSSQQAIDAHHAHITEAGTLEERRGAQPAQRGARPRRGAVAARARALAARRPKRAGVARQGRAPRGRPGERGGRTTEEATMSKAMFQTQGDLGELVIADPPLNLVDLDLANDLQAAVEEAEKSRRPRDLRARRGRQLLRRRKRRDVPRPATSSPRASCSKASWACCGGSKRSMCRRCARPRDCVSRLGSSWRSRAT